MQNHRECPFLSVLTDRVHQPLATVKVVPLYQMCGRVAYLRAAFLPHVAKVCEKFANFEWIFLYKPWIYILIIIDCFYISLHWSRPTVRMLHVILNEWLYPLWHIIRTIVIWQCYLVVTWLVPCETAVVSVHVCEHHTTMHTFIVSFLSEPHI